MFVGALELRLDLTRGGTSGGRPGLKAKRAVVRSLVDRLRSRFSVSVSEVGDQESERRAVVGVAVVGPDGVEVNSVLNRVRDAAESHLVGRAELVEVHLEILNVSFEHRRP